MVEGNGTQRALGQLEADVRALKETQVAIRDSVNRRLDKIEQRQEELLVALSKTKGAWRTIVVFGGIAATLGALSAKFLPVFFTK